MTSTNNVLHAVTGATFVVGLHNYINDESVLKFMITDDNTQLCYLSVVSDTLKKNIYVNVTML